MVKCDKRIIFLSYDLVACVDFSAAMATILSGLSQLVTLKLTEETLSCAALTCECKAE